MKFLQLFYLLVLLLYTNRSIIFSVYAWTLITCLGKIHTKFTPIFKSGNCNHIKTYHLISLLSNTSKVLEHLIYDKIIDHVSSYNNPIKFGFVSNRSIYRSAIIDVFTKSFSRMAEKVVDETYPRRNKISFSYKLENH